MIKLLRIIYSSISLALLLILGGCFTGIEGTKKITLSRDDRRQTAPRPEESWLDDVAATPHTVWNVGKVFYVADERASVMIDPYRVVSGQRGLERGDRLVFREAREVRTPDGSTRIAIVLMRGDDEFRYMARETPRDESVVMSDAMPGLIDPEMVGGVGRKLSGRALWTLSTLWLDEAGERLEGLKYDEVRVDSVTYGNMVFPLRVSFSDRQGRHGAYLMSFGNGGKDSRGFANLFSLNDPRQAHPGITDEVWEHIRRGEVMAGMTKAECRLAKGNPADVYDGHDYSRSLLLWVYPDASTLYFEDDILVRVKGY